MTKEMICIVCPGSCRLAVNEENGQVNVSGNACNRGLEHGVNEYKNPMRMLTSTVAINRGELPRLPVITTGEAPKERMKECLDAVYRTVVNAPILCGDIVISNVCGVGVDVVASRSMKRKEVE